MLYKKDKELPNWMLLVIVFITGASVLVIEIIGTRILSPFFGSGVYTWSALITTTLAALALGYIVGGRVADKRPRLSILFLLCFCAGFWTVMTPVLAVFVLPEFAYLSDMRVGVMVSSLLLFFPNLFFLGAVGPFCIRLITRAEGMAGSNSGLIFSVSTLGSLLAAIVSGFVLIPSFGVSVIFSACGIVLVSLSVIGLIYAGFKKAALVTIILLIVLLSITSINSTNSSEDFTLLDSKTSFYGQVQVIEKSDYKALLVDGVGQNYVTNDKTQTADYVEFIALLPQLQLHPVVVSTALVIGLGAGELPMLFDKSEIVVDVVEIDPIVQQMAEKYFNFKLPSEQIIIGDGRYYLNQSEKLYDYIVLDAFNSDQVAWHMLSIEALTAAKNRLTKNGLFAINFTSSDGSDDIASLYSTLKKVFYDVRVFSDGQLEGLSSFVYFASSEDIIIVADNAQLSPNQLGNVKSFIDGEKKDLSNAVVLSDDYNPVSYQRRQVQVQWRKEMRDFLGTDQATLLFN